MRHSVRPVGGAIGGNTAAGFTTVQITDTQKNLNVYTQAGAGSCCSGEPTGSLAELLTRYDVNEYAASVRVYALKG